MGLRASLIGGLTSLPWLQAVAARRVNAGRDRHGWPGQPWNGPTASGRPTLPGCAAPAYRQVTELRTRQGTRTTERGPGFVNEAP